VSEYVPSPREFVANQVKRYEESNGAEGTELNGLACVIVTHRGQKTGATRKTPLMRVKAGDRYVLVASMGGAPKNPVWVDNLRAHPEVTLRDRAEVLEVRAREVTDDAERARFWMAAVEAFPPYAEYQTRTTRKIPVFVLEPR